MWSRIFVPEALLSLMKLLEKTFVAVTKKCCSCMMSKQFNSRGGSYSDWVRFHFYWPIWHWLWNNVFKSILHRKFKLPLWQFLRMFQLIMELQRESKVPYTGGLFTGSPTLESESSYSGKKPDQNIYLGALHNHTLSWPECKCIRDKMQGISPKKSF